MLSSLYAMVFGSAPDLDKATKETIDSQIKSSHVFVASKTYCPYCKQAKEILHAAGANDAVIIELDNEKDGAAIQAYLAEITGQRTVPNIFINGKHIGGCSDLQELASSGKLKALL